SGPAADGVGHVGCGNFHASVVEVARNSSTLTGRGFLLGAVRMLCNLIPESGGICVALLLMSAIASYIDLSCADREPIHIPGSIQPHGVLLATEAGSPRVLQVAGETERILGRNIGTICGQTIAELLGSHSAALAASIQAISEPAYLGSVVVAGNTLC